MKKVSSILLCSFFAFMLVACGQSTEDSSSNNPDNATKPEYNLAESMERGQAVYETLCIACHMQEGNGLEGLFPPLAKSDYLMADTKRAIRQVIYGKTGEMVVNGITYNGVMPAQPADDQQIADVLNYVMNTWGNKSTTVITPEMVAAERD